MHDACFACAGCGKPIGNNSFFEKTPGYFHEACYHERFTPNCRICNVPLQQTYFINGWGEQYCARHEQDFPRCSSCHRLISQRLTGGGVQYPDGRHMCNRCRPRAVTDVAQAQRFARPVFARLADLGVDLNETPIPWRLPLAGELSVYNSRAYSAEPSGMTCTRYSLIDGKIKQREITEILVLYGLPVEQFQAIAAHELMHAWLFINGYDDLAEVIEEGLCELAAYFWLRSQTSPDAEYQLRLLEQKNDTVYGVGFQVARAASTGKTLRELVAYVKRHGNFPPVGVPSDQSGVSG